MSHTWLAVALMLTSNGSAAVAQAGTAAPISGTEADKVIAASLSRNMDGLDRLYRDIHAHPELSLKEERTASLLARTMRNLGFTVTEHVGGTGIVAVFRNGEGPTVMVRTELDALPMQEKTGLPYASVVQTPYQGGTTFVAHSCGHDVHMAWWVGTAQALMDLKSSWSGTLVFVGQPGEEGQRGAERMIEDGLFTRFPTPQFGFAAHIGNDAVSNVDVKAGAVTSTADTVRITFNGRGAHGSMPSQSIDPIVMGAHFVSDVQTVISREKDAGEFGVITVGAFQAGSAPNIIPDKANLALTLRSFSEQVRAKLIDGVKRTAIATSNMAAAPAPDITVSSGSEAVFNDVELSNDFGHALQKAGIPNVAIRPAELPGFSASEDYSRLVAASGMRSVYYGIGGYDPKVLAQYREKGQLPPSNHSPDFSPDHEAAIKTGVHVLALSVLSVMNSFR